jgi:hypothetical protein
MTTKDEELIANLNETRQGLITQFLDNVPSDQHELYLAKFANQWITNKKERREAESKRRQLKDPDVKDELKKAIGTMRSGYIRAREEELEVNYQQELEKVRYERKKRADAGEEDSEEVEMMFNMMKVAKEYGGDSENLGMKDFDRRYEFMEKMREKRHQRQKRESNYRPRDPYGNYVYDDPNIRTGVDDPDDLGLDPIDLSPLNNDEKKDDQAKHFKEDPFPDQYGDL